MLHRHTNAHLGDLEDGDRLPGALSMCQQQVQSSISIKVGHGTTCSEQNILITSYISSTGRFPSKPKGQFKDGRPVPRPCGSAASPTFSSSIKGSAFALLETLSSDNIEDQ